MYPWFLHYVQWTNQLKLLPFSFNLSTQPTHHPNLAAYLSLHFHNSAKEKKEKVKAKEREALYLFSGNPLVFLCCILNLSLKIVPFPGKLRWTGFSFGWGDFCNWFCSCLFRSRCGFVPFSVVVFVVVLILHLVCVPFWNAFFFCLFKFDGLIGLCMLMVAFEVLNFLAKWEEIDLFLFVGMTLPSWPMITLIEARKEKWVYAQMNWLLSSCVYELGRRRC